MANLDYKVLWIDDEHEDLEGFKYNAKRNGIDLIAFKSLNGGIRELEKNYSAYDGVILDAKFFEDEDDPENSEQLSNLMTAKEKLDQLPKKFELFILTGQKDLYDDDTFNELFADYYKKGVDDDNKRLFRDVKKASEKQKDTQIRHKYSRVFEVCTDEYIGKRAGIRLLNIIKNKDNIDSDNFNSIRKIIEDILYGFNKFNLLPDAFVNNGIDLTKSSKFLQGKNYNGELIKEKGFQHKQETHLPTQIARNMWNILDITQEGSHGPTSCVEEHVNKLKTPYLLQSALYQLFDIIIWFKIYIDNDPKKENWERLDKDKEKTNSWTPGKVSNINYEKYYAFFKPTNNNGDSIIPPEVFNSNTLKEGMQIEAQIEEYLDKDSGKIKTRVTRIK